MSVSAAGRDLPGYDEALTGAVYLPLEQVGPVQVNGADRLDFLQRQTTNDMRLLNADRVVRTVMASPTARILDVTTVSQAGDDLLLFTENGRAGALTTYLNNQIFFMDKVAVSDLSDAYLAFRLEGPGQARVLHELGITQVPGLDTLIRFQTTGVEGFAFGIKGIAGITSVVGVFANYGPQFRLLLERAGAVEVSPSAWEVLRVEAGFPGPGTELVDTFTPLEVGLDEIISDSKGCYTGQEVIARQLTYDKVTQKLVGILLSDPLPPGSDLVAEDGKRAGAVTSYAVSPRFGDIALAVIRRAYANPGRILHSKEGSVNARVVPLPFGS